MDTPEEALIPAGGRIAGAFAEQAGTIHRALAPVRPNGRPALQVVVDALRGAGVARITAVAEKPVWEVVSGVDCWLPAGSDGTENILAGLAQLPPERRALVCTSDLPLIDADDVADFAERASAEAGVTMGLVTQRQLERAHPDAPPSTFVTFGETGPVAPAGLFAVRPEAILIRAPLLRKAFAARKSQLASIRLLGPRLSWQFLRRRLSLADIVARAEGVLGCKVEVLCGVAPNLCYDIDSLNDYLYVKTYTKRAASGAGE